MRRLFGLNTRSLVAGVLAGGAISYAMPENLIVSPGIVFEEFGNAGDWTVANGEVANDTTNYISGTQSLKITTNTGPITCTATKDVNWEINDPENQDIRLYYYCYDETPITQNNGIYITFYSQTNLARYYQIVVYPRAFGWNVFHMRLADWSQVGVDTWETNVRVKFRISVIAKAGQVSTISFDRLEIGTVSQPAVAIAFDDGGTSVYQTAYNYMKQKRMVGTAYLITSIADPANYAPMYADGWDISNHTHDHIDLTTLSQADAQTQLRDAKTLLDSWGFARSSAHVAYPYGVSNATVWAAMAAEGMLTGRNVTTASASMLLNPLHSYYNVPGLNIGTPSVSLATAKGYIDTLIARGEMKYLLFHSLVESDPSSGQWTIADFCELIDYIQSKDLRTLTISEIWSLQTGDIIIHHK